MLGLAQKVASRYGVLKEAKGIPAPPPKSVVYSNFLPKSLKEVPTNDYAEAAVDFDETGIWHEEVWEWVPLSSIEPKDIWSVSKLKRVGERVDLGLIIPPVRLAEAEKDQLLKIELGVHRVQYFRISKKGDSHYTHVLAVVSRIRNSAPSSPTGEPVSSVFGRNKRIVNDFASFLQEKLPNIKILKHPSEREAALELAIPEPETLKEKKFQVVIKSSDEDRKFKLTMSGHKQLQLEGGLDSLTQAVVAALKEESGAVLP